MLLAEPGEDTFDGGVDGEAIALAALPNLLGDVEPVPRQHAPLRVQLRHQHVKVVVPPDLRADCQMYKEGGGEGRREREREREIAGAPERRRKRRTQRTAKSAYGGQGAMTPRD